MTNGFPALEIHIHLKDGAIAKFVQHDSTMAQKIIDHIQPTKLFSQRIFMIGSGLSMTAFESSSVVRIDFVAEALPAWPFTYGASDIVEVTEAQFRQRFCPDYYAKYQETVLWTGRPPEDQPLVIYAEIELANGEYSFFEVHGMGGIDAQQPDSQEPRLPVEHTLFMQHLFAASGLHARRHDSGIVVLNPANIVRFTFYPGPLELPPNCWRADRLPG